MKVTFSKLHFWLSLNCRRITIGALCLQWLALPWIPLLAQAVQTEIHRKALQTVTPSYPEMAKAMKLSGTVRLAVTVAPNGKVVSTQVLGGHPLLAQLAVEAVRRWKYEAASEQTNEVAVINFKP